MNNRLGCTCSLPKASRFVARHEVCLHCKLNLPWAYLMPMKIHDNHLYQYCIEGESGAWVVAGRASGAWHEADVAFIPWSGERWLMVRVED